MMNFRSWICERVPLEPLKDFLSRKLVPQHRYSYWYLVGGLSLFFFLIQLLTGVLLLLYYSPTPNSANESVHFIVDKVPVGWLVHSIHYWSANLMIACVLLHFFSTFFMKAYRKPRELMWLSGVILLFVILGFGFTGYLLPWDTTAYFATQIGTEVPRSIPVLGNVVVTLLRGGEYIAEESLTRLFALHVIILPLTGITVIFFHLVLNQVYGTSIPIGTVSLGQGIRFYPNYLYRDALSWLGGLMILLALSLLFPISIGAKADPFSSAPVGIKPEWYFLPLYQTLRMVPASLGGINSEIIVNLIVMLLGLLLLSVPFIDKKANIGQKNSLFKWTGIVAILYLGLTICLAYLT